MVNILLRAELFALATAAKAYYLVHGGSLERSPLDIQNFCTSVDYCLTPDAPVEDTTDEVLVKLLNVGISIIADDAAAASIGVSAALARAREIVRQHAFGAAKEGGMTIKEVANALALSVAVARWHIIPTLIPTERCDGKGSQRYGITVEEVQAEEWR